MVYKVRFPESEKDCKKVLSFCKKREGKAAYNRPVMDSFIERFDSGVMTILYSSEGNKEKVEEVQRYLPVNAQNPIKYYRESASQLKFLPAFKGMSEEDIVILLMENEDSLNSAIGKALLRR